MTLWFPSREVLHRAIIEVIPPKLSQETVKLIPDDSSAFWLEFGGTLTRKVINDLRKLGVETKPVATEANAMSLTCWAQALPLISCESTGPALVRISKPNELPHFVASLQRLGIDDIRWHLDDVAGWLLLAHLPLSILLRAEFEPGLKVFWNQSDNVWLPWGWRHPIDTLPCPPDQTLFILGERDWQCKSQIHFRPMATRFHLHPIIEGIQSSATELRISVKPRLAPAHETEPAELWVVDDIGSFTAWLSKADARSVGRLNVAQANVLDRNLILLWARSGRGGPPVLVIESRAYRRFQKLPNLFLPVDMRLSPSLRRDLAKRAFAADSEMLTWISQHDQSLAKTSIPISAFEPLTQWVRYRPPAVFALTNSSTVTQIEFEPFEIKDRPAAQFLDAMPTNDVMIWLDDHWQFQSRPTS